MSRANSSKVLRYFLSLMKNTDQSVTIGYKGLACRNVQAAKYLSYSEQNKWSLYNDLVFPQCKASVPNVL